MIGIISDIHSNKHALDAVLDDMPPVDSLVCTGDIVGYAARPSECLERVRDQADVIVQGNHDRNVSTPSKYRGNSMAFRGLQHSQSKLSDDQIAFLSSLPKTTTVADAYHVVHSHPTDTGVYVRPRDFPRMRPHVDEEMQGMFLGHTHIQHKASIDGRLILNPGSVGQPRDGDPQAAYAVVDPDTNEATLHRVPYDRDAAQEAIQEAGLPKRTASRLSDGQ